MPDSPEFYRRHLPHWQPKGAVFFVTFRLKNSLPKEVIASLREPEHVSSGSLTDGPSFVRWDLFLDKAESGPHWLARPEIAELVKEALLYRDGRNYRLHAFCIMPNHVHTVFEPLNKASLGKILQSLKRQIARKANRTLGREGAFWQDETYDRVVRENDEFNRIIGYVLNNPVKAGLVSAWKDWPWTYFREGAL